MQSLPTAPAARPTRRRPNLISVRVSDTELEQIRSRAEAHSRTPTDYVRRTALGQIPALRSGFTGASV